MLKNIMHNLFNIKNNKSIAFTLAEVLIVMGVIGIVAEMTIPDLMTSFQKQVTVTQLKETYTILNAALGMAKADYGTDISQWTIQNSSAQVAATSFAQTYLLPYLKTNENCGTSNSAACAYNMYNLNDGSLYEAMNGADGYYSFILLNGTLIAVNFWDNTSTQLGNDRFVVFIDVNARNKPNVIGKDIFILEPGGDFGGADKNKLWPYAYAMNRDRSVYLTGGSYWADSACNKTTGSGNLCFALILVDGWQIKSDYPWLL